MIIRLILAIILFSVVSSPAFARGPLTLADAWQKAVSYDPALKAYKELINESKGRKMLATSPFLPKVGGEVSITRYGKAYGWQVPAGILAPTPIDILASEMTYPQYTVGLEQTIFDSGRSIARFEGARQDLIAARHTVDAKTQDRAVDLVTAFCNYYLSKRRLEVARSFHSEWAEHARVARARYEQQMVPYSDILSADVGLSEAGLKVKEALDQIDVSAKRLASMIGEMPGDVARPSVPFPPEDVTTAVIRPEIKAKEALAERAKNEAQAEALSYLPEFYGKVEASYTDDMYLINKDEYIFQGGVRVPLFDGLTHWSQRRSLKAEEARHRFEKQAMLEGYSVDLENIRREWMRSDQEIKVASINRTKTSENLRISRERYATGLAQALEVREAVSLWADSLFKYHLAVCQRELTAARLRQAVGVPVLEAGGGYYERDIEQDKKTDGEER